MEYEIRKGNLSDSAALKQLWMSSFGESESSVDRFFDRVYSSNKAFVATCDGKVVAMMFLLGASLRIGTDRFKAGYVYSVATDSDYRGNGIMKSLEKYLCEDALGMGIRVVVLVPASKSLFKMYEKIGYKTSFYMPHMVITPKECGGYELLNISEGYSVEDNDDKVSSFTVMRNNLLQQFDAAFELDEVYKSYRFELLKDDDLFLYRDSKNFGYIAGKKEGHNYEISETSLPLSALPNVAYALTQKYFKLSKIGVSGKIGSCKPYGMLKSLDDEINVFDVIKTNPYMNLMLE